VEKSEPILGDVEPGIIQGMVSARKAFNAFLDDGDVDSASAMSALIKTKESFLLALDKTFDHEMQFLLQQMGPQGETRVLKHVLSLMPKPSPVLTQPTHQKVLEGITALQASKLLQMQSKGVQGQLQNVKDMIQKMVMGKPPGISKQSSQFAVQVANALPNFYSCDKLNDDGTTTTKLLGKQALQHSFKYIEAMICPKLLNMSSSIANPLCKHTRQNIMQLCSLGFVCEPVLLQSVFSHFQVTPLLLPTHCSTFLVAHVTKRKPVPTHVV
jgi:hypothetical protein